MFLISAFQIKCNFTIRKINLINKVCNIFHMIALIIVIISTIMSGISLFLQKIGFLTIKKGKKIFFSFKWLLGTVLMLISFFMYLLALKIERIVIIQPLLNISILVLIILEAIFLKTKLKIYEIFSIILFMIGITLICVY